MAISGTPSSDETHPPGKTAEARERNAALLSGYDYSRYPGGKTGYTGQDLQRVGFIRYREAIRTRVGPRGNYKAGLARLADGRLVLAACRDETTGQDAVQVFQIHVYESADEGLSWREIAKPGVHGKEPSLAALPDGGILMTAQNIDLTRDRADRHMIFGRSEDGGRTWEMSEVRGLRYPRNMIVEQDGSPLFLRSTDGPDRRLQLCRSRDGGRTWDLSETALDWEDGKVHSFGEVSAIRLDDGTLLASLRHSGPEKVVEGFHDTMVVRSGDDGESWSRPARMLGTAEVHVYLTELVDGRILATYSNYHLPFGVCAVMSEDGGRTWDLDHPIQLSLSADHFLGWPVTLELPDGSLITSYAGTTYREQPPEPKGAARYTCEVVRWRPDDLKPPPRNGLPYSAQKE